MEKKDRKKQFHAAVIRTLYPPPEKDKIESTETLDLYHVPDDYESEGPTSSSDGGEEEGNGGRKLTRAQRKRLRKKKLKQAASQQRRKIIGPLLPVNSDAVENEPQGVRQNASEGNEDDSKEETSGAKREKIKRRRMAKKMASDVWKLSSSGKNDLEKEDS